MQEIKIVANLEPCSIELQCKCYQFTGELGIYVGWGWTNSINRLSPKGMKYPR